MMTPASMFVWTLLAAVYLLFAGQVSADEIASAIIVGGAATGWSIAVRHASARRFGFDRAAVVVSCRALLGLPAATFRVGAKLVRAIARPARGHVRPQTFVYGARDRPEDSGRRAIATLAASLAPDSFVLRMSEPRNQIEIHVFAGKPPRSDPRWPI